MNYKFYRFPNKNLVPKIWPANVSVVGIGESNEKDITARGWLVNVCYQGSTNLSSIKQYEITVNTPKCTWFGQ